MNLNHQFTPSNISVGVGIWIEQMKGGTINDSNEDDVVTRTCAICRDMISDDACIAPCCERVSCRVCIEREVAAQHEKGNMVSRNIAL